MLPYTLQFVLIGQQDGEDTLARLQQLVQADAPWSVLDRLDLMLLPLMTYELRSPEVAVREGLQLAQALPRAEQGRAIGGLLAVAYHYLEEAIFNRLFTEMKGMNLLAQAFEESKAEGRVEGLAEGRIEGVATAMRHFLKQRFGAIPPALDERITASDFGTLTQLFDRALTATSINDL